MANEDKQSPSKGEISVIVLVGLLLLIALFIFAWLSKPKEKNFCWELNIPKEYSTLWVEQGNQLNEPLFCAAYTDGKKEKLRCVAMNPCKEPVVIKKPKPSNLSKPKANK